MSLRVALVTGLAIATEFTGMAQATTLNPTDMRGIRDFTGTGGSAFLLGFSAVKSQTEDRTVAHFDLSGVSSFTSATLQLSMQDADALDPGTSSLDIYSFAGDGTVSIDEWDAGTLLSEQTGLTGLPTITVTVDITSELSDAITAGDPFLSFNLRNETGDLGRFSLSHVIDGTFGSITSAGPSFIQLEGVPAVPLPAGGLLLLTGLGLLVLRRQG